MIPVLVFVLLLCATGWGQSARHIVTYSDKLTCGGSAPVVDEVYVDVSPFPCSSVQCTLTVPQAQNTMTSSTSCLPQVLAVTQPMRFNIYRDAQCANRFQSRGLSNMCAPGTIEGTSAGASQRFMCDSRGNFVKVYYSDSACAAPTTCFLLASASTLDGSCPPAAQQSGLYVQGSCPSPSVLPAVCNSVLPATTTTAAPTTRPANPYDFNGDGVVDYLDVTLLMDNWGSCRGCIYDVANYNDGMVNIYDLVLVLNNYSPSATRAY